MKKIIKYKEFENLDIFDEWEDVDETESKYKYLAIISLQNAYHLQEYDLEPIGDGIYRYGNDRRIRVNMANLETNGYSKTYKGVVYKEGHREDAMKALRLMWSGTRGGLTRKIRNRQEELDIFINQKNSLDQIFN